MNNLITETIRESVALKKQILRDAELLHKLEQAIQCVVNAYRQNKKVLFCGNGGSAADAQHLAAELSGRFYFDRPALFAEALHVNSSFVTAVANDYGYDHVFERMVNASGCEGDVCIALSTSGNSPSVVNAMIAARQKKMETIGFTGQTGGLLKDHCSILLNVPSENTPRIQEAHILMGHIVCEQVEKILFESHRKI